MSVHLVLYKFMCISIGDLSSSLISVSTSSASISVQCLLLQFQFQCLLQNYETNLFMFFEKHQIVITINYIIYNILNFNSILWILYFLNTIPMCVVCLIIICACIPGWTSSCQKSLWTLSSFLSSIFARSCFFLR